MSISRMVRSGLIGAGLFAALTTCLYAADITGKWSDAPDHPQWTFNFKSDGATLTGTMVSQEGKELPIKDGKIEGDSLSFSVDSEWQGQPIKLVMKGKIAGDTIELRLDTADGAWGTDVTLKRASASGK
ncbi:MAG: hypothetical protein ACLQOO_37420 [Terriglobia bacterium]